MISHCRLNLFSQEVGIVLRCTVLLWLPGVDHLSVAHSWKKHDAGRTDEPLWQSVSGSTGRR